TPFSVLFFVLWRIAERILYTQFADNIAESLTHASPSGCVNKIAAAALGKIFKHGPVPLFAGRIHRRHIYRVKHGIHGHGGSEGSGRRGTALRVFTVRKNNYRSPFFRTFREYLRSLFD